MRDPAEVWRRAMWAVSALVLITAVLVAGVLMARPAR